MYDGVAFYSGQPSEGKLQPIQSPAMFFHRPFVPFRKRKRDWEALRRGGEVELTVYLRMVGAASPAQPSPWLTAALC